uniref:Uncharacterized protein n=1 Tax=Romanomermis culicivorax TaxID=13658 RepID=A0A915JND1_ROMCU
MAEITQMATEIRSRNQALPTRGGVRLGAGRKSFLNGSVIITVNGPVTLTKILNICREEWTCLISTNDVTEDHYLIQTISGPKISHVDELTAKNMFYVNTGNIEVDQNDKSQASEQHKINQLRNIFPVSNEEAQEAVRLYDNLESAADYLMSLNCETLPGAKEDNRLSTKKHFKNLTEMQSGSTDISILIDRHEKSRFELHNAVLCLYKGEPFANDVQGVYKTCNLNCCTDAEEILLPNISEVSRTSGEIMRMFVFEDCSNYEPYFVTYLRYLEEKNPYYELRWKNHLVEHCNLKEMAPLLKFASTRSNCDATTSLGCYSSTEQNNT